MSYQSSPPPPPPASGRSAIAVGPAATVIGIGVAATSLFGLPLSSQRVFDYTDYTLLHTIAAGPTDTRISDLFHGFQFWWSWGRLTFGIALLALATVLIAGVAQRFLGVVLAVLALAFGVAETFALI